MGFYLICGTQGYAVSAVWGKAWPHRRCPELAMRCKCAAHNRCPPSRTFLQRCRAPGALWLFQWYGLSAFKAGTVFLRAELLGAFAQLPVTPSPRRLAPALSPALAGYMLTVSSFGWPLVVCGGLKVLYDSTLLNMFQSVKPPEEEVTSADITK